MQALVFLENDVDAFHLKSEQYIRLQKMYPDIKFNRIDSIDNISKFLPQTDVFITWQFKKEWYPIAQNLKAICTPAAGKEWIELDKNSSVSVYHGTFHGKVMAESLIGMMLFFNRRFHQFEKNKLKKRYDRNVTSSADILCDQHVFIVGYGHIGKECARLLKAFGCKITGVKRTFVKDDIADTIITIDSLPDVIGDADHVIAVLPKNSSTDNLFKIQHFQSMKSSAFFYNIGRGNCVRHSVLLEALQKGYICGAGLDVFETEPLPEQSDLWNMENVFIMPHASAICKKYLDYYFDELGSILKQFAVT